MSQQGFLGFFSTPRRCLYFFLFWPFTHQAYTPHSTLHFLISFLSVRYLISFFSTLLFYASMSSSGAPRTYNTLLHLSRLYSFSYSWEGVGMCLSVSEQEREGVRRRFFLLSVALATLPFLLLLSSFSLHPVSSFSFHPVSLSCLPSFCSSYLMSTSPKFPIIAPSIHSSVSASCTL